MKDTRTLVEISLLVALAIVLDLVATIYSAWIWQQGGAITASMVPLALIAFRHGPKMAIVAGLMHGLIRFQIANIFAPWQIVWDFLLPSMGSTLILGLWANKIRQKEKLRLNIWLSVFVAQMFRFVSHWWSGVILFYMFNPRPDEWSTYLYSFIYNFPQNFFNWLLVAPILLILLKRYDFAKVAWKKAV